MMKKGTIAMVYAVMLVGVLAGCSSGTGAATSATSASTASTVTLDFTNVTLSQFCATTTLSSLRPLAASADGSTIYGGYIKSSVPADRGIAAIDAQTGTQKWIYNPGYESYTKGVAADDRGNVYVGIAHAPSEDVVSIDIVSAEGKKISTFDIKEAGEFGVNGLAIYRNGESYILYIVTNYGPNRIYAYDVTDAAKPVADTSFGNNGVVNLKMLTGNDACEGTYLVADSNGDLYMTANLGNGNKGDCVLKISANGTKAEKAFECTEAYGIDMANGYIFVSTYEGAQSHVYAYQQSDYHQVMKVDAIADSTNYAGVVYVDGKLYVSDQSYNSGARILETPSLISEK